MFLLFLFPYIEQKGVRTRIPSKVIDSLIPDKFKEYGAKDSSYFLLWYPETDAETIQAQFACAALRNGGNPEIRMPCMCLS